MRKYNKLIRDNIPQLIMKSEKKFKVRLLNDEEYKRELRYKLLEEANELINAKTREEVLEELADAYEVLDYVLRAEKIDLMDVQEVRVKKNMEKGAFDEKILLEYVKEWSFTRTTI